MQISSALQASHDLYRQTHDRYPDYFGGYSLVTFIHEIGYLIKHGNITTAVDYGCGKARAWKNYDLKRLWNLQEVQLYDPGVEQFAKRPTACDLVICTDVMEHVPEDVVDEVLQDVCSLANKAVFFNISTQPASKKLVDGSNAHATVRPRRWWQEKLSKLDKLAIAHYS